MKNSTSLKQSECNVRFLMIAVPWTWVLYFAWVRHWVVGTFAVYMSVSLLFDAWNIWMIRREAKKDPEFLKKKVS